MINEQYNLSTDYTNASSRNMPDKDRLHILVHLPFGACWIAVLLNLAGSFLQNIVRETPGYIF